jgi:Dynein heavy chain, N-terminal region 1
VRADKLKLRYEKFLVSIGEFENKLFEDWSAEVTDVSRENLQQPLLIRKPNKELALNFHPQVNYLEI